MQTTCFDRSPPEKCACTWFGPPSIGRARRSGIPRLAGNTRLLRVIVVRAWTRRGKTSERLTAAKATPTTHMTSPDLTAPETPDVDVTVPETKPAISFAE